MSPQDKTAFFITCRTLGDYLLCNTPIPPGVVRVRCMNCGADGTITAAGALELAKGEGTRRGTRGRDLQGDARSKSFRRRPTRAASFHVTASAQRRGTAQTEREREGARGRNSAQPRSAAGVNGP